MFRPSFHQQAPAEKALTRSITVPPDAILMLDEAHRITFINERAEIIFRCAAASAIGVPFGVFLPEWSEIGPLRSIAHRADGTEFHVEGTVSAVTANAAPNQFIVVLRELDDGVSSGRRWRRMSSLVRAASAAIAGKALERRGEQTLSSALRQTQSALALIIEHAPSPIAMFDRNMRYIAASRRWVTTFVGSMEPLIGRSNYEVFKDVPERWRKAHQDGLSGRIVEADEDVWERSGGPSLQLRWKLFPWRDAQGDVGGIVIFAEDVTERKKVEEMLQETEQRFHRLFDGMLEGCQIIGFDWNIRYVNESLLRQMRQTRSQFLGRAVSEAFAGIESSTAYSALKTCMTERTPLRLECRFEYPNGKETWFDLSVQPSAEGIFVLSNDITERKRAEFMLRESNERFRHLADSLPQQIWASNSDGLCDYVSRQWVDFTGVPFEQHLGMGWLQNIHPLDRERLGHTWTAAVASGDKFHCEFRVRRHDGVYRWFDARGLAQRDETGRVKGWYGGNTDIEDQKNTRDAQLRNQKIEALGALASGIAHDFNNILLAISGNTRLALEDTPGEHPSRQSLLEIERASGRATDLVRRILTFSRQEEPQRRICALQPVIEEALKLLRATTRAQIELRARFSADAPRVVCDTTQIHQVLMNLVTNAAYAIGDQAGIIEIVLEPADLDQSHPVPSLQPGRFARLTVSDTGCGMEQRTIERIFDPFFTTKPLGHGTGLGLSVVSGIMRAHGGTVTVQSEPGRGTDFQLYFPATTSWEEPDAREVRVPAVGHSRRVLYVDDDPALVLLGVRKLTRLGYEVTGEPDPEQALARFADDPGQFDVVITDLSMPRMPGFELARQLRAIRADLPIIVASGYVTAEDQLVAKELNIRKIILKPDTSDELGSVLDGVLRLTSSP